MRKLHIDEPQLPMFRAEFDGRLYKDAPPYHETGYNDWQLERTYTIDLDREVFSVDNGAHFHLGRIPKNDEWIKALSIDRTGKRLLLPQLVPAETVATLALDPPTLTASTEYETLQTRLVKPKSLDHTLPSLVTGPRLRWMLFNSFQTTRQQNLSTNLLSWKSQDLPFREFVFFILCLATGGEQLSLVDQRHVKKPYHGSLYLGMTTSKDDTESELATYLGVGYHLDGLPMGSAPNDTKYWFEGALVSLVPRLDHPGIVEKAIADAIEYGRSECNQKSFNAVLISIEHLVLIKSLPGGHVDRTELLPLVSITTHYSKDARARYGDSAINAFYDKEVIANDQKVEETNRTDVEQLSQGSDQQDSKSDHGYDDDKDSKGAEQDFEEGEDMDDNGANVNVNVKREDASDSGNIENEEDEEDGEGEGDDECEDTGTGDIRKSFMALVQFFESTQVETLRPTQPNEARLPEEICQMVLRNVSDTKTYHSCLRVSRRFRFFCQQRPLVMDNIVFLEPLPGDPTSMTTKKNPIRDSQAHPDFLAVEVTSGREMEVHLNSGGPDALTCYVVAGNERNRKSYANCVTFQGLLAVLPSADEGNKTNIHATRDRNDEKPLSHGSEGTPWQLAFKMYKIKDESDTYTLGQFWQVAAQKLERPLETTSAPDWTLPPNTLCYFDNDGRLLGRPSLYLRVKRASKYRDNQWDDIVREATEDLNNTNDRYHRRPEAEVLGADEPYVILTVGTKVRLFKCEQGFDESVDEGARRKMSPSSTLRELVPGMVLSIYNKEHRERIENFMDASKRLKKVIMARWMKEEESEGKESK